MEWLAYAIPAGTAFGGAILGTWLRGRQDAKARHDEERAKWRQAVVDDLPAIDHELDDMLRVLSRFKDGFIEFGETKAYLLGAASDFERFRPLMFRLGGMHPDAEVRDAARALDKSMVLLPLDLAKASHPSRGERLAETGREAIDSRRSGYETLLTALRS